MKPQAGETWYDMDGKRFKITSVGESRVAVLDMDSGNRTWLTLSDLAACYKRGSVVSGYERNVR